MEKSSYYVITAQLMLVLSICLQIVLIQCQSSGRGPSVKALYSAPKVRALYSAPEAEQAEDFEDGTTESSVTEEPFYDDEGVSEEYGTEASNTETPRSEYGPPNIEYGPPKSDYDTLKPQYGPPRVQQKQQPPFSPSSYNVDNGGEKQSKPKPEYGPPPAPPQNDYQESQEAAVPADTSATPQEGEHDQGYSGSFPSAAQPEYKVPDVKYLPTSPQKTSDSVYNNNSQTSQSRNYQYGSEQKEELRESYAPPKSDFTAQQRQQPKPVYGVPNSNDLSFTGYALATGSIGGNFPSISRMYGPPGAKSEESSAYYLPPFGADGGNGNQVGMSGGYSSVSENEPTDKANAQPESMQDGIEIHIVPPQMRNDLQTSVENVPGNQEEYVVPSRQYQTPRRDIPPPKITYPNDSNMDTAEVPQSTPEPMRAQEIYSQSDSPPALQSYGPPQTYSTLTFPNGGQQSFESGYPSNQRSNYAQSNYQQGYQQPATFNYDQYSPRQFSSYPSTSYQASNSPKVSGIQEHRFISHSPANSPPSPNQSHRPSNENPSRLPSSAHDFSGAESPRLAGYSAAPTDFGGYQQSNPVQYSETGRTSSDRSLGQSQYLPPKQAYQTEAAPQNFDYNNGGRVVGNTLEVIEDEELEGLNGRIVDAALLRRVQQIIEEHERSQLANNANNNGLRGSSEQGYSQHNDQSSSLAYLPPSNAVQETAQSSNYGSSFDRPGSQGPPATSSYGPQEQEQLYEDVGENHLVAQDRSGVAFQKAILSTHFTESENVAKGEDNTAEQAQNDAGLRVIPSPTLSNGKLVPKPVYGVPLAPVIGLDDYDNYQVAPSFEDPNANFYRFARSVHKRPFIFKIK